jgi:hypothetical protein
MNSAIQITIPQLLTAVLSLAIIWAVAHGSRKFISWGKMRKIVADRDKYEANERRASEAERTERLIAALNKRASTEALDTSNEHLRIATVLLDGIKTACEGLVDTMRSLEGIEGSVERLISSNVLAAEALNSTSTPEALELGNKYLEGIHKACEDVVAGVDSLKTLEPTVEKLVDLFAAKDGEESRREPGEGLLAGLPYDSFSAGDAAAIELSMIANIRAGMKPELARARAIEAIEKKNAMSGMAGISPDEDE